LASLMPTSVFPAGARNTRRYDHPTNQGNSRPTASRQQTLASTQ
jgi:hypothetical protein